MEQEDTNETPETPNPIRESFSSVLPSLQLAHDSVSIGAAKTCKRYYKYSILDGWTDKKDKIDLEFGIYFHSATEEYHRAEAKGKSHDEALESALDRTLSDTWRSEFSRPWDSTDPNKNRGGLIRSVIWYVEHFKGDSLKTVILSNGKPAIEVPFSIEIGYTSRLTGEKFLLCGRLDKLGDLNGQYWIVDKKTTKYTLGPSYFARYTPDNQVSTYSFAGSIMFPFSISGVIIDAAQILKDSTRFQRGFVPRSKSQLEEWIRGVYTLFSEIETCIETNHWPMNDRACGIPRLDEKTGEVRYGCQFREVCAAGPEMREKLLALNFKRRFWDPVKLQPRD